MHQHYQHAIKMVFNKAQHNQTLQTQCDDMSKHKSHAAI